VRPGLPSRDGGTTGCDDEGMRRIAAAPPTPGQPGLLSERGLIGARAAGWGLAVLAVLSGVAGLVAQGLRDSLTAMDVLIFAPFMAFGVVGGLIAARRPSNPLGWLCGVGGAAVGLFNMASYGGQYAVANGRNGPGVSAAAWVVGWTPPIGLGLLLTFVPLLFPTGSLTSPRWCPVAWTAGVAIAVAGLAAAFVPGVSDEDLGVANPLGLEAAEGVLSAVLGLSVLVVIALIPVCAVSVLVRFRRAGTLERQQIKWLLVAVATLLISFVVANAMDAANVGAVPVGVAKVAVYLALLAVPVSIGVAVLRYQLLDIDVIISRGTVYLALTAGLVISYLGIVALMAAVFDTERSGAVSLVATGLVALVFAPLRHWLQRHVNRWVYGERADPYAVVSRLGRRLQEADAPGAMLAGIVNTIASSLRLPFVAIERVDGGSPIVHGSPTPEAARFPLSHEGQVVAFLVVGPRTPGEPLAAADRRVLDDVARLAALAARSAALADELQRSRRRIVTSREEERRRLRRDLHDGLGPTLAGVALRVEAGLRVHGEDPAIKALLTAVRIDIHAAIADVRHAVYDLRPPALDEFGLIGALQRQADSLAATVKVVVDADEGLGDLPAAVEVAAYRIATEAIANCIRHAGATLCHARLHRRADKLELEITDNGIGLSPGWHKGVGVTAMQERSAELGGTCTVAPAPAGGTRVCARLPLPVRGS
jgi:signal transduction histidine kinase